MTADNRTFVTSRRGHWKVPGVVESVDRNRQWTARLIIDGIDCYATMRHPLPAGMGEGHIFTIHTTKRGHQYIYWIKGPRITERDVIRAHQRARRWMRLFADAA